MSRRRRAAKFKMQKKAEADKSAKDVWDSLAERIYNQTVIPIVGDSVRLNAIFDIDYDDDLGVDEEEEDALDEDEHEEDEAEPLTIDQELAEAWSGNLEYPMPDKSYSIARIAQYNRVRSDDAEDAKRKYLTFLKEYLLFLAVDDVGEDVVDEIRGQVNTWSFADIVSELGYPTFETADKDPLRILASLDLPFFITTSPFDFLERALVAENKEPRTEVCFWSGEPANVKEEHQHDPDFRPDPQHPLVYHLFGLEAYPRTLVLSENDYLDFLMRISKHTMRLIPETIWGKIAISSLVLVGYRLSDWDFRILFRGFVNGNHSNKLQETDDKNFRLILQLLPEKVIDNEKAVQDYLKDYFQSAHFAVEWGEANDFIHKLGQHYFEKYKR